MFHFRTQYPSVQNILPYNRVLSVPCFVTRPVFDVLIWAVDPNHCMVGFPKRCFLSFAYSVLRPIPKRLAASFLFQSHSARTCSSNDLSFSNMLRPVRGAVEGAKLLRAVGRSDVSTFLPLVSTSPRNGSVNPPKLLPPPRQEIIRSRAR